MAKRPSAKKAPAKRKAPTKAKSDAMVDRWKAWEQQRTERLQALEAKVVEQAEYITKQERTIAKLLALLNKGP